MGIVASIVAAVAATAVANAMASVKKRSIPGHCSLSASQKAKKALNMDTTKINIGVTGNTKSGKSKLINTLRGLRTKDKGAAPTGVVEKTTVSKAYPFPRFEKAVLWDMPGAGTKGNPTETYFKDKHLIAYDIVIIVYCDTIKEIDGALAKALQANGVPFFVVRSKTDQAMEEGVEDGLEEGEIVGEIKRHARSQLNAYGVKNMSPFCVSGLLSKCKKYDMMEFIAAVGTSVATQRRKL